MEDYLVHYGVLGMKWGVRKDRDRGTHLERSIRRTARKDAKKYAKLKYDYGAQSRTSRSLHNKSVDVKRKKLGDVYSQEYDKAKKNQNYEKLAARSERKHQRDILRANRNVSGHGVKKFASTYAGASVGAIAGAVLAFKLPMVNPYVIQMGSAVVGAALASSAVQKRYDDTMKARRKLNYNY